jgi:hypothetical protein
VLKLSDRVKAIAVEEGITLLELETMVERAAVITKGAFNRRYHNWVFSMSDETAVEDMRSFVMRGGGSARVDHQECAGKGCKLCGWWGKLLI